MKVHMIAGPAKGQIIESLSNYIRIESLPMIDFSMTDQDIWDMLNTKHTVQYNVHKFRVGEALYFLGIPEYLSHEQAFEELLNSYAENC